MIILKQCEHICIVADEKDMISGNKNILIMYRQKIYSGKDFSCITEPNLKQLYPHIQDEYKLYYQEAMCKWGELEKLFSNNDKQVTPSPAPVPAPASGVGSKLEEILMKTIAEQSIDEIVNLAKPMLEKHILETFGVLPQIHEVKTPAATHKVEGTTHECYDKVLNLVNADIPVFLSGAAGTGKNVICKQIAEGMGLDFYFTNAVTQEYQLKGFIDANGTFHETQFFKAFTQGGLFFLDEMDGSIPETLIILNAAIANRYFDFPTGKVEAHPDFRVIAAGNTVGTGADIEYTGRYQLDASSLDRFALITVDYSPAIEKAVTNGNEELCEFARAFRKVTQNAGIRCLCTYRAIERIAKLESSFPLDEVLQMSLTKGLGKDDLKIIIKRFSEENVFNKYVAAMKKIR